MKAIDACESAYRNGYNRGLDHSIEVLRMYKEELIKRSAVAFDYRDICSDIDKCIEALESKKIN